VSDNTRRTVRTTLEGAVTLGLWLALFLPDAVRDAGVDPTSVPGLAGLLAILTVVARLAQTRPVDRVLTSLDIGREPKHRA